MQTCSYEFSKSGENTYKAIATTSKYLPKEHFETIAKRLVNKEIRVEHISPEVISYLSGNYLGFVGYVENAEVVGDEIHVEFSILDVTPLQKRVKQMIENKEFRAVSIRVVVYTQDNEVIYVHPVELSLTKNPVCEECVIFSQSQPDNKEVKSMSEKVDMLELKMAEAQRLIEQYEAEIETLNKEKESLAEENSELRQRVEELEQKLKDVEQKLEFAEKRPIVQEIVKLTGKDEEELYQFSIEQLNKILDLVKSVQSQEQEQEQEQKQEEEKPVVIEEEPEQFSVKELFRKPVEEWFDKVEIKYER